MEEQSLIPYEKNELTVINLPHRRRKRKKRRNYAPLVRKILPTLALLLVGLAIALNFSTIKEYIFSESESTVPTVDSSSVDAEKPVDEAVHQYKFTTVTVNNYETVNESGVSIDFDLYEHTPANIDILCEKYGNDAPIVLIVHFSPKEAYSDGIGYSETDPFYSEEKNVLEIGKALCTKLNENGIGAIHIESYGHEGTLVSGREMYINKVKEVLKLYPSISYVLDVSRDICTENDKNMIKETVSLENNTHAPIKIICGTNDTGVSKTQKDSIAFANDFAKYANSTGTSLITKLTVGKYDFALDFSVPSIRIDVGSYANSYKEASNSVLVLSDIFSNYLTQNEKPST